MYQFYIVAAAASLNAGSMSTTWYCRSGSTANRKTGEVVTPAGILLFEINFRWAPDRFCWWIDLTENSSLVFTFFVNLIWCVVSVFLLKVPASAIVAINRRRRSPILMNCTKGTFHELKKLSLWNKEVHKRTRILFHFITLLIPSTVLCILSKFHVSGSLLA